MRKRFWHYCGIATGAACAVLAGSWPAQAHVKWFCAFDVAGQPRGLENVLCPDFELLVGLALFALTGGCLFEGTRVGMALSRALDRVTAFVREDSDRLIRAFVGFFLVALWSTGGILLTPELKTTEAGIPWFQLALAFCTLWRATLPLAGIGLVTLFAEAVTQYGAFHLMDYPVFLGLAAYLVLTGLERTVFGLRPLDVLRGSAAITLMWASVEKWAYPEWTFPLLSSHPDMTLGYDAEFFMRAAGVIEFALAFSLLWTPLVRRVAGLMLLGMFVSAIGPFGKIDAIGHAPIIGALLAIVADPGAATGQRLRWAVMPAGFLAALSIFLAGYYASHAALYPTRAGALTAGAAQFTWITSFIFG